VLTNKVQQDRTPLNEAAVCEVEVDHDKNMDKDDRTAKNKKKERERESCRTLVMCRCY
jgi:hypothetical protein